MQTHVYEATKLRIRCYWLPCVWTVVVWLPRGCRSQWGLVSPSCLTFEAASALLPEAHCGKLPALLLGLPDSLHGPVI